MMTLRKHVLALTRAQLGTPVVWGENDCLCFAGDCAAHVLGRDPVAHLRGRYDSAETARAVMDEHGWATMGDLAASLFAEIPIAAACFGDWATLANPDGSDALGVVAGERIATRGPNGVGQVPLTQAVRAFRVA